MTSVIVTTDRIEMAQKKNYQKTKQQKLEQEQALAYRQEQIEKRNRIFKAIGIAILSILLIFAFCFPAIQMLL